MERIQDWYRTDEANWLCKLPVLASRGDPQAMEHLTRALAVAKPRLATALAAATVDAVLRQRVNYAHLPMLRRLAMSFIYVDTDAQGHVAETAAPAFDFTRAARQSIFAPGGGGVGGSLGGPPVAGLSRLAEFMRHTPCFDRATRDGFNVPQEVFYDRMCQRSITEKASTLRDLDDEPSPNELN